MRFRTACPADAPKLLEIYREYIDTTITFEYALPSVEEFEGRIRSISEFFPYLVLEDDAGTIVGYAYAHRHMERAAYQWNAELSIYLSRKLAGKGWGRKSYRLLLELLALQGMKAAYGCVTSPNPPSEKLHMSLGFELVGTYPLAGWKNGAWHSVSWFRKAIGSYEGEPVPPKAFDDLPREQVEAVLERWARE